MFEVDGLNIYLTRGDVAVRWSFRIRRVDTIIFPR